MPSYLRANRVASVPTTRLSNHAWSMHGLQPITSSVSHWSKLRCPSDRQRGSTTCLQAFSNATTNYAACRRPQGCSFRGRPTKHRKLCQRVEASIALQGAPGILIGLGALFAGVAFAAFLLAAIPTVVVCMASPEHGPHLQLKKTPCMPSPVMDVQSIRRAARAMETMLYTVEREVPETAAAMRLSSMELSDAIEEVTLLG